MKVSSYDCVTDMTDEERINTIDLVNGVSAEDDVIWALNYLLNHPDEDDLPLFA